MTIATPYNIHSNTLLSQIVRLLNSNDANLETISNLINESTTAQLVPSFAFIVVWLSSNSNAEAMRRSTFQVAYHLLHIISTKVPPIILLCGIKDLNWASPRYHHHHSSFILSSFFERLHTVRSFVKPFAFALDNRNFLSRFSKCHSQIDSSLVNKYLGMLMEIYSDTNYTLEFMQHFKSMILNHAPINAFKNLLSFSDSSIILTFAIIHLLHKFNNTRKLKHQQLLYYFSLIFRYINIFVASNNVNGLLITHQILNMPFVSPFLLIGMVNNIPKTLYIYNLLIPKRLTKGDITVDEAKQIILDQFKVVDLSFDNELDRMIKYVPQYLFSFFLDNSTPYEMPTDHPPDTIDYMLYMQLSNKNINEKFNKFMSKEIAQVPSIPSLEVISMDIQMDKFIIHFIRTSLYRGLLDQISNSSFWSFFTDLLATVIPTHHEIIAPGLLQMILKESVKNELIPEFFIFSVLTYFFHIIIELPYDNNFIPFLFSCLKISSNEDIQILARLTIMKIIKSDILHLSDKVVELIKASDDLIITLDYIEALQSLTEVNQLDDAKNANEIVNALVAKLPYSVSLSPVLILNSFAQNATPFNSVSNQINQIVASYLSSSNVDLSRMLNQVAPNKLHLLLRILSSSSFIQKAETATVLTERTIYMLNCSTDNICFRKLHLFQVSSSMLILPVAQHLLRQLLIFGHHELAYVLLDAMIKPLTHDLLPLHWILQFLKKNYNVLTNEVKDVFDKIVSSLPNADQFYLSQSKGNSITDVIKLVQNIKIDYQQNPDVIKREITSTHKCINTFSSIAILLRKESVQDIVSGIVDPIYKPFLLDCSNEALCAFSFLLSNMPMPIIMGVFSSIIQHRVFMNALNILKYYLVSAPIDIFQKICESATAFAQSNDIKLRSFMYVVIPSFCRLQKDEEVATKLLCGLLENVNPKTSRTLQENVIDIVGMIYVMLKLQRKRASIINSAKHFLPDLKAIIASSLDIDVGMPTSFNFKSKPFGY